MRVCISLVRFAGLALLAPAAIVIGGLLGLSGAPIRVLCLATESSTQSAPWRGGPNRDGEELSQGQPGAVGGRERGG
jgi:hypothetical protein